MTQRRAIALVVDYVLVRPSMTSLLRSFGLSVRAFDREPPRPANRLDRRLSRDRCARTGEQKVSRAWKALFARRHPGRLGNIPGTFV